MREKGSERERKVRREISRDEGGARIHDARGEIERERERERERETKNMIGKKRRYMDASGVTDGTKERKR